jgi:bifunctional non-homologous end joining protein LigD
MVRLWTRNAVDFTDRFSAIAAAASRLKADSFTIDGEAVVIGPDGLSRFDELRRREGARTAVLYAFDLVEHDGEDLRDRAFLERKATLARLLRGSEAGILLNEHFAEDGATVFEHACKLGAEASCPSVSMHPIDPARMWPGSRFGTPPASPLRRERSEDWNR